MCVGGGGKREINISTKIIFIIFLLLSVMFGPSLNIYSVPGIAAMPSGSGSGRHPMVSGRKIDHHSTDCSMTFCMLNMMQVHLQILPIVYEYNRFYFIAMEKMLSDDLIVKYPQFLTHLERRYFDRKDEWAISVRRREEWPTHGCNTNNNAEILFRVMKDGQFNRTKVSGYI